ncbi:MAG: zinc ABC transporter substrate-binding protein [Chlorobi bacterium]|nr:zinc ABC transporter substrate-binding protein [Chlorobiota bacterium]
MAQIKKAAFILIIVPVVFLLIDCEGGGSSRKESDVIKVFAVNYPLAYFTERIGGEHVRMIDILPKDTDPAEWAPGKKELRQIRSADLILLNGAGYEPWAEQAGLPSSKTVNATATLEDYFFPKQKKGRLIPDTWLDFDMSKFQAESVRNALEKRLPAFKDEFENNFFALYAEMNKLNKRMVFISNKMDCDILYLYAAHPVYDYMAAAYHIRLLNLYWEPGAVPTDEQWRFLEKSLENKPANAMLWESPPPEDIRRKLENDFGIIPVIFNPCTQKPDTGDFISVMKQNVDNLAEYSRY